MAAFTTSARSAKAGDCLRLANLIAKAAEAMGLHATLQKSRLSASHYVYVTSEDDDAKIRCSDHDDKHGGADLLAWVGTCPSVAIARLAARFGRAVPEGFRAEDFAARSAQAKVTASARIQARQGVESAMTAAVVEALTGHKTASKLAAGRALDALYPSISRAQRQRIADAASRAAQQARQVEAAK